MAKPTQVQSSPSQSFPKGFLSDSQIRAEITNGHLLSHVEIQKNGQGTDEIHDKDSDVTKLLQRVLRHASFEIWVGKEIQRLKSPDDEAQKTSLEAGSYRLATYENKITCSDGSFQIEPGQTYKIWAQPRLNLQSDVLAWIAVSGSINESGLIAGDTYADPGFSDKLSLIVRNTSQQAVVLQKGDPLARVFFYRLSTPVQHPYPGRSNAVVHAQGRFVPECGTTQEARLQDLEKRSARQTRLLVAALVLIAIYMVLDVWGIQNLWAKVVAPLLGSSFWIAVRKVVDVYIGRRVSTQSSGRPI